MISEDDSGNHKREKFTSEKPAIAEETSSLTTGTDCSDSYGPALPPHLIPICKGKQILNGERTHPLGPHIANDYRETYGPQIPTGSDDRKVIGPEIPKHLLPAHSDEEAITNEGDDFAVYGPSLSLMANGTSGTEALHTTLCNSRRKGSAAEAITKRETWMVELPPERANSFGLGPRQFRSRLPNEKDSDRSGWTETPMDKGKGLGELEKAKRNDAKIISQKQIEERNAEMERLVKKIEKKEKRDKSLLEIHRKKRKKDEKEARKREKEGTSVQRRPFDRNVDLQVQKFDLAQRNAVLKKAALLNDRFAQGESKFL